MKLWEALKHFEEGLTVQWKPHDKQDWRTMRLQDTFNPTERHLEFRIKPEPREFTLAYISAGDGLGPYWEVIESCSLPKEGDVVNVREVIE